jgi:RNA polymerase sigma factor (sigma-70 family)
LEQENGYSQVPSPPAPRLIGTHALTRPRLIPRSRRLLAALGDERLVAEARRDNEAACEAIYDRYHKPLLAFCRHMVGSRDDSEDVLQHTFASAFRSLRDNDNEIQLKPWLYAIARNRCLDVLRARREEAVEEVEVATRGLPEAVERRAELKDLLSDLGRLPEQQRAALVLCEVADLGHPEIAQALDCETNQVKAFIFQARSALIADRHARGLPCAEVREQLATATGPELRRSELRRHLERCPGCAEYADEVKRQRAMLAVALPVIPSLGLKESALAAAGIGGGGAAGGGGGLIAALGVHGATKAVAITLATGGAVGGVAASDPALIEKARAAVERAAGGIGELASRIAPSAEEGGSPDSAARSFDWEGAKADARRETRKGEARNGRPADGASKTSPQNGRSASAPGQGRGRPDTAPSQGRGNAYGRDGNPAKSGGRHAGGPARSSRGRGSPDRGGRSSGRGRRGPLSVPDFNPGRGLGLGNEGSFPNRGRSPLKGRGRGVGQR